MSARTIQYFLASVFLVLGSWCVLSPSSVLELAITPEYRSTDPVVPILMGAFGAQALIAGTFAAFAKFTRTTFLAYGVVLLPFFVFDYWFYFVEPMLTVVGLLDLVGNVFMLWLCWLGWRASGGGTVSLRGKLPVKAVHIGGIVLAIVAADLAGNMAGSPVVPSFVGEAHALVGQPLTPRSFAGVGRRVTRRAIRRSTIFVKVLPPACIRTSVGGTVLWRCGPTWYQPYGRRYVVVYVN